MPTIDEAIERACAAYAAHVGETIFEDGMRAALSAFLADVPVSENVTRGEVSIAKAYCAKLAEEIQ